ncbi:hypothetical protein K440DRAFT_289177 [Wilcoxina mikolae CBS 423.85]|nr:hypothetical protein K440DRAFT_289177 [Wilcoxina mikolae CBS 423.85]
MNLPLGYAWYLRLSLPCHAATNGTLLIDTSGAGRQTGRRRVRCLDEITRLPEFLNIFPQRESRSLALSLNNFPPQTPSSCPHRHRPVCRNDH